MGAPRLIESDVELDIYTKSLFDLTAKEDPTGDEIDVIQPAERPGATLRGGAFSHPRPSRRRDGYRQEGVAS
jgi:hypothetical protein